MALILAAVMAVSCLTTILLAASKPLTEIDLGSLSQYYETGTNAWTATAAARPTACICSWRIR